ncbi:proteophosphoglycan ppg4 [Rhodotorula toruloides]|uniref:Proteophosphoglycan ppg4 n=1 Tax=Rhodotorula toruloides TaxID=5286 RepID=A0A511KMJ5_RHOTO|nr:proteophosphoglycan ppg4 [Rhodotorula toruloides]
MAKSAASKGKQKAAPRLPSPAPSASSESPSSASGEEVADSSSSESDRDSSASPEPVKKNFVQAVANAAIRKYSPPEGFKALRATSSKSALDWDDVKEDEELELFAVRVPAGLKAKHLEGAEITLPEGALADPVQPVACFSHKKSEYEVRLANGSSGKRRRNDDGEGVAATSELHSLVPLLARKSHGNKLYQAPRPISRTLTITRALPSSVKSTAASLSELNDGHSTLIISQPSSVPGAILTADELLDPSKAKKRKEQIRGDGERDQPDELIKFRAEGCLPGTSGREGGKGRCHNPVKLPERYEPPVSLEVTGDVEMADGEAEEGGAQAASSPEKEQKKREKVEKKARKEAKRATEGEPSPKKKKVKVEA